MRVRHERFHQLRLRMIQLLLCFFTFLLGEFLACHSVWIVLDIPKEISEPLSGTRLGECVRQLL